MKAHLLTRNIRFARGWKKSKSEPFMADPRLQLTYEDYCWGNTFVIGVKSLSFIYSRIEHGE